MEQLEETRSTYKGELRRSPITNKFEPYYPSWKRLLFRLFITIPMICINILLVSCLILIIIRFQSWIDRQLKTGRLPRMNEVFEKFFNFGKIVFVNSSHVINRIITENFISISNNSI
jgi:anoctamin-8